MRMRELMRLQSTCCIRRPNLGGADFLCLLPPSRIGSQRPADGSPPAFSDSMREMLDARIDSGLESHGSMLIPKGIQTQGSLESRSNSVGAVCL